MKAKLSILILLTLLLTLMVTAVQADPTEYYVAPGGDDGNACLTPDTACATIQAAVNLASSGDVINVLDGAYEEQVVIDAKVLTLKGESLNTIIKAPDTIPACFTTSATQKPIVCIRNDAEVDIDTFTIDGAGKGNANNRFSGVAFYNASGTLQNSAIIDIRDTPFSGTQHGVAIFAYNNDGVSRTLNVWNNTVTGFQKTGMALNASDTTPLEVNVRGNTVNGVGPTTVTAQNGIQVWADLGIGTVAENIVTEIAYDNTDSATKWVATSILNFYADLDITGNTISGAHMGIYNIDAVGNITGNDLSIEKIGVYAYGIIATDPPEAVPSPYEPVESGAGAATQTNFGITSVLNVNVSDNNVVFDGPDNIDTYGIEADAGYGPDDIAIQVNNNLVSGFEYGLVFNQGTDYSSVFTAASATGNGLDSNTYAIYSNLDYLTLDASGNWLGANDPGAVAVLVDGDIDYTPWLDNGLDTSGDVGFQGDFSALWVDDDSPQVGTVGRVQEGVNLASGSTVNVVPGIYAENVNVNKALHLRGSVGGDFSGPVPIAATQAPGVWYTDRYAPGVFESFLFNGEMVLHHGIRGVDVQSNSFYNYQGRKLDTNLTGPTQSMSIDLWVDASWNAAQRNAGIWATGFDIGPAISAYPIMAWRSGGTDPEGFYAFDYINGGWLPLMMVSTGDYGKWHTLSFVLTVHTGIEYFVNGESKLVFSDPDTTNLNNLILNAYNFGVDYDVYWDNWMVSSDTPTTYESVINGRMTISASNVEVTGLYLTNPGQTNAIVIDGTPKPSNVLIANNRIQDVGAPTLESHVHAIHLNRGPDNVTIANNVFSNLKSGMARSVSAVGVLDSASTDPSEGLVVENNSFSDIASAGRGAYGIIINNAAGAPGALVKNNTFSGLNGGWTHAVGLEGPTLNAVVTGNRFSDLTAANIDNSAVFFEKNPDGDTVTVATNQFNGPSFYGVAIHPNDLVGGVNGYNYEVDATYNWWNSPCGPSAASVNVGPQVVFSPWWGDPTGSFLVDATATGLVVPDGATTAEANAIFACAPPYGTVEFEEDGVFDGGIVVSTPGLTINLNGGTVGAGSPAFTIAAADVTIQGPGVLDGNGDASPGVLVVAGGDNFTLKDVEVREWADGVEVAANVTSFKLFDNWIHSNADAGLQINSDVTLGGVVSIQGNLFKVNGGNGIQHAGNGTLPAEYNSWGHVDGPSSGDGVGGNVDADPWTFAEVYLDVDPTTGGDQYQRAVNEGDTFDVALMVDAANLYGISFRLSYSNTLLTLNGSPTFSAPWAGTCLLLTGLAANEVGYQCALIGGPEWDGGTVATFNFTANGSGLTGNGPWSALFDISHEVADTSAGAIGGAKVFVNNAGFNDPSVANRDITDDNDGEIVITGLANFTGFVDLQGRFNDSGATIQVFDVVTKTMSTVLAEGTSANSGAFTTAYLNPNQLLVGTTYYFQINRPLFLPTTIMATDGSPIPADWEDSKVMLVRPFTSLSTVVLLGGDATNSNYINIGDATCIGGQYGLAPGVCGVDGTGDVNGDGVVNILDLTLMGGNYEKNSSPWTP